MAEGPVRHPAGPTSTVRHELGDVKVGATARGGCGLARIGIQVADFSFVRDAPERLFPEVTAIARAAEDAGFSSLWVMDHFHQFPPIGTNAEPMPEAYVLLGAIAGVTQRIELGTLVTAVTYRNPAMLAKMVTTLDVISGGRAWLGIGASWQQDEYRAYGFGDELPGVRSRLDLLEDALRIARAMFAGSPATVEGRTASVRGAMNVPPPVRDGGPRILVGGSGERRLLRLVARHADACNLIGDPDAVRHKLEVLDRHCADVGRDPTEIRRTHLGGIVVADSVAEAETRVRAAAEEVGMDVDTMRSLVVAGRPEGVREHCEALLAAGLDELIFHTAGPWSAEHLRAAGAALAPLL